MYAVSDILNAEVQDAGSPEVHALPYVADTFLDQDEYPHLADLEAYVCSRHCSKVLRPLIDGLVSIGIQTESLLEIPHADQQGIGAWRAVCLADDGAVERVGACRATARKL